MIGDRDQDRIEQVALPCLRQPAQVQQNTVSEYVFRVMSAVTS